MKKCGLLFPAMICTLFAANLTMFNEVEGMKEKKIQEDEKGSGTSAKSTPVPNQAVSVDDIRTRVSELEKQSAGNKKILDKLNAIKDDSNKPFVQKTHNRLMSLWEELDKIEKAIKDSTKTPSETVEMQFLAIDRDDRNESKTSLQNKVKTVNMAAFYLTNCNISTLLTDIDRISQMLKNAPTSQMRNLQHTLRKLELRVRISLVLDHIPISKYVELNELREKVKEDKVSDETLDNVERAINGEEINQLKSLITDLSEAIKWLGLLAVNTSNISMQLHAIGVQLEKGSNISSSRMMGYWETLHRLRLEIYRMFILIKPLVEELPIYKKLIATGEGINKNCLPPAEMLESVDKEIATIVVTTVNSLIGEVGAICEQINTNEYIDTVYDRIDKIKERLDSLDSPDSEKEGLHIPSNSELGGYWRVLCRLKLAGKISQILEVLPTDRSDERMRLENWMGLLSMGAPLLEKTLLEAWFEVNSMSVEESKSAGVNNSDSGKCPVDESDIFNTSMNAEKLRRLTRQKQQETKTGENETAKKKPTQNAPSANKRKKTSSPVSKNDNFSKTMRPTTSTPVNVESDVDPFRQTQYRDKLPNKNVQPKQEKKTPPVNPVKKTEAKDSGNNENVNDMEAKDSGDDENVDGMEDTDSGNNDNVNDLNVYEKLKNSADKIFKRFCENTSIENTSIENIAELPEVIEESDIKIIKNNLNKPFLSLLTVNENPYTNFPFFIVYDDQIRQDLRNNLLTRPVLPTAVIRAVAWAIAEALRTRYGGYAHTELTKIRDSAVEPKDKTARMLNWLRSNLDKVKGQFIDVLGWIRERASTGGHEIWGIMYPLDRDSRMLRSEYLYNQPINDEFGTRGDGDEDHEIEQSEALADYIENYKSIYGGSAPSYEFNEEEIRNDPRFDDWVKNKQKEKDQVSGNKGNGKQSEPDADYEVDKSKSIEEAKDEYLMEFYEKVYSYTKSFDDDYLNKAYKQNLKFIRKASDNQIIIWAIPLFTSSYELNSLIPLLSDSKVDGMQEEKMKRTDKTKNNVNEKTKMTTVEKATENDDDDSKHKEDRKTSRESNKHKVEEHKDEEQVTVKKTIRLPKPPKKRP